MSTNKTRPLKTDRVYHPWWKWECYPAGFYATTAPVGIDNDQALEMYRDFLGDLSRFEYGIIRVFADWPHSCEQFLTNESMNRVAWIGQSAMCRQTGVPSKFRGGYRLLSVEEQFSADLLAEYHLREWLCARDY